MIRSILLIAILAGVSIILLSRAASSQVGDFDFTNKTVPPELGDLPVSGKLINEWQTKIDVQAQALANEKMSAKLKKQLLRESKNRSCVVAYEITVDGKAEDIHLVRKSGLNDLDALSIDSIRKLKELSNVLKFPRGLPPAAFKTQTTLSFNFEHEKKSANRQR